MSSLLTELGYTFSLLCPWSEGRFSSLWPGWDCAGEEGRVLVSSALLMDIGMGADSGES